MRTGLPCPACIIDDLRGALQDAVSDETLRRSILREALAELAGSFDYEHIPSFYITRAHRLLKTRAGVEMPFRALRERCNAAGLALAPRIGARAAAITDPGERLRFLIRWAIAGNHLDFRTVGTGYDLAPDRIEAALETVLSEGLAIDHTPRLLTLLRERPRVLYLADNVGEIALDMLLIRELQDHYGCTVTVAVKGGPITSDAVLADAEAVGLTAVASVIVAGPDTLGIPIDEEMSAELRAALASAGLVIAKGQANYYALSELAGPHTSSDEYPVLTRGPYTRQDSCGSPVAPTLRAPCACLLRTKCLLAASSLGLDCPRANVAAVLG